MKEPLPPTEQPTSIGGLPSEIELVLLTVEEAAQSLSIGRTTMYALLKEGHVNSVRIGRLRRIPAEALTAYTNRLAAEQNAA
jgi:excisionase family DNA binding protein